MGTVKFDRTLSQRFVSVWFLAGNSSVLAGVCLVLPCPSRSTILMFRRTFLCPRSLVLSVLCFRLRWRGSYFFVSVPLLGCTLSGAALLFFCCGAAPLRGFGRLLWRKVSAIQTARAQTSQHTAQQGAAPDRLQPVCFLQFLPFGAVNGG